MLFRSIRFFSLQSVENQWMSEINSINPSHCDLPKHRPPPLGFSESRPLKLCSRIPHCGVFCAMQVRHVNKTSMDAELFAVLQAPETHEITRERTLTSTL